MTLERVPANGANRKAGDVEVAAGPDGSARVFLDPSRLTPGDYQIAVLDSQHEERFALHASAAVKQ